jgi:hypothetical protein
VGLGFEEPKLVPIRVRDVPPDAALFASDNLEITGESYENDTPAVPKTAEMEIAICLLGPVPTGDAHCTEETELQLAVEQTDPLIDVDAVGSVLPKLKPRVVMLCPADVGAFWGFKNVTTGES